MEESKIIELNLNFSKKELLNEVWLPQLSRAIRVILNKLFGGVEVPVKVTGNKLQIITFAKAIAREKSYIIAAAKYGLDHPKTYKNKYLLQKAIANFERAAEIKWPFKN